MVDATPGAAEGGKGGNMIRLTERCYDTRIHGYLHKSLLIAEDSIEAVSTIPDGYDDYSQISTKNGDKYVVLESIEAIAELYARAKEEI